MATRREAAGTGYSSMTVIFKTAGFAGSGQHAVISASPLHGILPPWHNATTYGWIAFHAVAGKNPGKDVPLVPTAEETAMCALERPIHPMPEDVDARLEARGLREAYDARPPYQRNDYLGWIGRAARPETREKRIAQMLDELEGGDSYMGMAWRPAARSARVDGPGPGAGGGAD